MLGEFAKMAAAATWLIPGTDFPFHWDEDCEALIWDDGTTIVFREELAQILERLERDVLPPAGTMMLLLAACRGKVPSEDDIITRELVPALFKLHQISTLPSVLKGGVAARAMLVRHALEDLTSTHPASLDEVVKLLRSELPFSDMLEMDTALPAENLEDCFSSLLGNFRKFDQPTLELLLSTGLPALLEVPESLEPELPVTLDIGKLLVEMLADPELAGIARAARQIMAAVTLPQALSRPEDESLGGVSDIGNRGPLHRLLLSELAHDDETLAARLALNEALYLRREPAGNFPPSQLVLLVDAGVRMWGLPRLFATAAALTFVAKAGKCVQPAAFRSAGSEALPVTLWTREGLTEQLGALDSAIDPTAALAALLQRLDPGKSHVDLVVITHCRTLEEKGFIDLLPAGGAITAYAVGVNREGHVSICTRTAHSLRQMNEAWIDPATLFGGDRREAPRLRDPSGQLPAIFLAQPFPFLLPPEGPVEVGWATEGGGGVCLTTRGVLWHWSHPARGAVKLAAPRLKGRTLGLLHARAENCWVAVKHNAAGQRLEIVRWFPERGVGPEAVVFTASERVKGVPSYAFTRGGYLYVVFTERVSVLPLTGLEVGHSDFPEAAHPLGTRFLDLSLTAGEAELGIFYWRGLTLNLTTLRTGSLRDSNSIVLVFDRQGHESPWAVDQTGRIFDLAHPEKSIITPGGHLIEARASSTGNRVWLRFAEGAPRLVLLDLGKSLPGAGPPERLFDDYAEPRRCSLRSKFTHIGLSPAGGVMLRTQKGHYVELTFVPTGSFVLTRHEDSAGALRQITFAEPRQIEGADCTLRCAEWPDGSRAFLDSRGLLHLQSRDVSLPEVSFVLTDHGPLPAWSSDGKKIGPAYFAGDHHPAASDAEAIASCVERFASAIL